MHTLSASQAFRAAPRQRTIRLAMKKSEQMTKSRISIDRPLVL